VEVWPGREAALSAAVLSHHRGSDTRRHVTQLQQRQRFFWTAVLSGLFAPPLLVLMMLVSTNRKVLKDRVNAPVATLLGWISLLRKAVQILLQHYRDAREWIRDVLDAAAVFRLTKRYGCHSHNPFVQSLADTMRFLSGR